MGRSGGAFRAALRPVSAAPSEQTHAVAGMVSLVVRGGGGGHAGECASRRNGRAHKPCLQIDHYVCGRLASPRLRQEAAPSPSCTPNNLVALAKSSLDLNFSLGKKILSLINCEAHDSSTEEEKTRFQSSVDLSFS